MSETMKKKAAKPKAEAASRTGKGRAKPPNGARSKRRPDGRDASPETPAKGKKRRTTSGAAATKRRPVASGRAKDAPGAKAKRATGAAGTKPKAPAAVGKHVRAAEKRSAAAAAREGAPSADLFLEKKKRGKKKGGRRPPKRRGDGFGTLNACLAIGIAVLVALGISLQVRYGRFLAMREVVDRQTFYEGTTVEGVDVSSMTLSNARDYWRDRVEPRFADRAAQLDDGESVTARELGYSSDYESVLYAAWSAGRSGSLEERYRMAEYRSENPVSYRITRSDYSEEALSEYVAGVAERVNREPQDAAIQSFDAENYEFVFTQARPGSRLNEESLKQSLTQVISAGGGSVSLPMEEVPPRITTEEVSERYGLIDYAITNANSSSRARINNIKLAMSMINGTCVKPGETFSFNEVVGQRTTARGFTKATAYSGGDVTEQVGGGICQVSTTLFNAAVKADMEILERHSHSLTVSYVDKGKDATVNWGNQDFRFRNTSEDDIYICCYLTQDKRVRFGIFGRLLPDGEKITLDAVTTEVVKYDTEYEPTPLLAKGQTFLLQPGRNGYKAEAYKIRWDAEGNQISKELLCKSVYKKKNEIIQYGT